MMCEVGRRKSLVFLSRKLAFAAGKEILSFVNGSLMF